MRCFLYLRNVVTQVAIGINRVQRQFGITADNHQEVIEIMRDATRQLSDGIHLLSLPKLSLQLAPLSDVTIVADKVGDVTFRIDTGSDRLLQIEDFVILIARNKNSVKAFAGQNCGPSATVSCRR